MDASQGPSAHTDFQTSPQTTVSVFNFGTNDVTTSVNIGVGESDGIFNAILGGVITVVILVLALLAVVVLRYMYRHNGSYHTNEAKGTEFADTANASLRGDPVLQGAVDESRREYFI